MVLCIMCLCVYVCAIVIVLAYGDVTVCYYGNCPKCGLGHFLEHSFLLKKT